MGFRNPITSVADVDTRVTPAGAGVRVYEDNSDPNNPKGIVGFSDGWANDTDATITQHSTASQRQQNASDSGGLLLSGGTYASTAAPNLDLAVVANGDGSHSPVAKLTGGVLTLDRPLVSSGSGEAWTNLPYSGAWTAWNTGADQPAYRRDVSGEVHVRGILKLPAGSGGIGAGASLAVCTMPAGYFLSGVDVWRQATLLNASGVFVAIVSVSINASGQLSVSNNSSATAAAGYGFAMGFSYPTT